LRLDNRSHEVVEISRRHHHRRGNTAEMRCCACGAILNASRATASQETDMAKKKTEKALKAIEKDVKKALRKGATEAVVGDAVNRAIKKAATKGAANKTKVSKRATGKKKPSAD
jgi:hypothetical protein